MSETTNISRCCYNHGFHDPKCADCIAETERVNGTDRKVTLPARPMPMIPKEPTVKMLDNLRAENRRLRSALERIADSTTPVRPDIIAKVELGRLPIGALVVKEHQNADA